MGQVRSPRQARSQRRRDALLQAAVELLADSGMQMVTHRAVAARAGLPPSTVGYFFATIDDLITEALRVYIARSIEQYLELASAEDEDMNADTLIHAIAHHQADPQLALAQVSIYVEASRNPQLRRPVVQAVKAYRRLAEDLLRAVGVPAPKRASTAFQALLDGLMLHRLAQPDDPPRPKAVIDAMEALLVGQLLDHDERQVVKQRLRRAGIAADEAV